jgi:sigma-B regulation protein RsbU (phosphoserine phosphatase)
VTEAMTRQFDFFGEQRLSAIVAAQRHLPLDELRERVLREVDAFVEGAPQHDDMTIILLRVEPQEPQEPA